MTRESVAGSLDFAINAIQNRNRTDRQEKDTLHDLTDIWFRLAKNETTLSFLFLQSLEGICKYHRR